MMVLGGAPFGSNHALSWAPLTGPLNTNFLVVTNTVGQQFFRQRMQE